MAYQLVAKLFIHQPAGDILHRLNWLLNRDSAVLRICKEHNAKEAYIGNPNHEIGYVAESKGDIGVTRQTRTDIDRKRRPRPLISLDGVTIDGVTIVGKYNYKEWREAGIYIPV